MTIPDQLTELTEKLGDAIVLTVHLKEGVPCDAALARMLARHIRNCACAAQAVADDIAGNPKPKIGP